MRPLGSRVLVCLLIFGAMLAGLWRTQLSVQRQRDRLRDRAIGRVIGRPAIFFGDSHIECAIDDRVDGRIVNVATSSEHYVLTAQKVRLLRPRLVVIGFSLHNLLPYYEHSLGPVFLSRYDLWSPSLSRSERQDILSRLDFESLAFVQARTLLPFLGTQLDAGTPTKRQWLGGFKIGSRGGGGRHVSGADARRRLKQMLVFPGEVPSAFQAHYLEQILEDCKSSGTPVVLLSTPVHTELRRLMRPEMDASFASFVAGLQAKHAGVRLWSYVAEPLEDGMFRDPDHLSAAGAAAFTRKLVERLAEEFPEAMGGVP
jgi:hypothetical protein